MGRKANCPEAAKSDRGSYRTVRRQLNTLSVLPLDMRCSAVFYFNKPNFRRPISII